MKKYLTVKQGILNEIKNRILLPGDKLPSCEELQGIYKVSAVTVRHAVSELIDEDVLYAIQGSGTYVQQRKVSWRTTSASFYQNTSDSLTDHEIEIQEIKKIRDKRVAAVFGVSPEAEFTFFKRVRIYGEERVAVSISYLPLEIIDERDYYRLRRNRSLYKTLFEKNIIPSATKETFTVEVSSNKEIYSLLCQSNNTTLLHGTRLNYDEAGKLFEYTQNYFLASRYRIVCWHTANHGRGHGFANGDETLININISKEDENE